MDPAVVISTGVANTASVLAALRRAGLAAVLTTDAAQVATAERVVLPGVGAFGAGMATLREHGLVDVLRDRVRAQRPTLAVCLGLQLLCARSEESPGVDGLGIIDAEVRRLPDGVRVPQFGWNTVDPNGCHSLSPGYAYYANSFCLQTPPPGWNAATTVHGIPFVAALERGPVLACQFHPELSGAWGADVLSRWVRTSKEVAAC